MCYDRIETSYSYLTNFIITINLSAKFRIWRITIHYPRERGQADTYYRSPVFQKGARDPIMLPMFLPFSAVSLFSIVRINPFSPSPSHSATASQSFGFTLKIFDRSGLAWGGGGKLFFIGAHTRSQRPCNHTVLYFTKQK